MAKNRPLRVSDFPPWTRTVGAAIKEGARLRASCDLCHQFRAVDLQRLLALKGPDYSLVNRRSRCTLTEDCKGWVTFHYLHGVYRRLYDDETAMRWMRG